MSVALSPEGPESKEGMNLFYAKGKVCLELISKKEKRSAKLLLISKRMFWNKE